MSAPTEPQSTPTLASPSPATAATLPSPFAGPAAAVIVPGYEILAEVGRGGMGVVYRARHLALQRTVALKMILAGGHAGPDELQRFRTEAKAIARLQHPHIVQVYEIGEHEGRPFLALEFCDGGTLEEHLKGTPLPPVVAAQLAEALARAVHAAHEKGIVHRDLKPANVLFTVWDPAAPPHLPKIVDFGLAKKMGEASHTHTGAVMGTPSYMAPEQAIGNRQAIGTATDIYALGAVLYECLTGRPPFKAATAVDTIMQVMNADPAPPRQLQPGVPRDLETICLKCLHKVPARRYTSAAELADDLYRYLKGEPIQARPVGRLERIAKWVKRRPAVAALVAVVALVTLAGLAGIAWAYGLALEERDKFAVERNNALKAEQQAALDRDNALKAEHKAAQDRDRADAARKEADKQRKLALIEQDRADKQRQLAEKQLAIARSALLTSQLLRVAALAPQHPDQGLTLLHDLAACPLDLRDWSWDYYAQQCNRCILTVAGKPSVVALSPDGSVLAVGQQGGAGVQLWDTRTAKVLAVLDTGQPLALAFSPDGKTLAVGGKEITLWQVPGARLLGRLQGLQHNAACLAFSGDGALLASGGGQANVRGSGELKVWDVAQRKLRINIPLVLTTQVASVAFDAGGKRLVYGTALAAVVCDTATGEEIAFCSWGTWRRSALLSQTDSKAAAGYRVWPIAYLVAFTPDGEHVLSVDPQGLKTWHTATATLESIWPGLFSALLQRPDKTTWVAGHPEMPFGRGNSGIFDLQSRQQRLILHETGTLFETNMETAVFNADGTHLAALERAGPGEMIKVWRLATDDERLTFSTDLVLGRRQGRGEPIAVAVSPDGRRLAVAVGIINVGASQVAGELIVCDAVTKVPLWQVSPTAGQIPLALAFSPDGQALAVSWVAVMELEGNPRNGKVQLYEAATGKEHQALAAAGLTAQLAFAPDGKTLVGTCMQFSRRPNFRDGPHFVLAAWDLATASLLMIGDLATASPRVIEEVGRNFFGDLGLAAHGRFALLKCDDHGLRYWDTVTGQTVDIPAGKNLPLSLAGIFPDGKSLVLVERSGKSDRSQILVWDLTTNKARFTMTTPFRHIDGAAMTADGRLLATTGSDGTLKVWDLLSGQERVTLPVFSGGAHSVLAFSRDGQTLVAVVMGDNWLNLRIRVWARNPQLERAVFALPDRYQSMAAHAVSPDGKVLAVAEQAILDKEGKMASSVLHLWELGTGQPLPDIIVPRGQAHSLAFAPDSKVLATGGPTVHLWDIATGKRLAALPGPEDAADLLVFADQGRALVGVSATGLVKRWEVATGKVTVSFALPGVGERFLLAADAEGKYLVAARGIAVVVWDLATGKQHDAFQEPRLVSALALTPDGRTMLFILADGTVHARELATGKQRPLLAEDDKIMSHLQVSPDGKLVAVVREGDAVKVCSVDDGKCLASFTGPFQGACFSPDSGKIFVREMTGTVRLWDLQPFLKRP
jgi:WD40 repeat protein